MITFKVEDKTQQMAAKLGPNIEAAIDRAVLRLAYSALAAAQQSIQKGPKTGRVYKRGRITHQASAPGEAPATDRGRLVSSLQVDQPEKYTAVLFSPVDYATYLEFGTRKMAARPFMRPAGEAQRAKAPKVFSDEIAKATK